MSAVAADVSLLTFRHDRCRLALTNQTKTRVDVSIVCLRVPYPHVSCPFYVDGCFCVSAIAGAGEFVFDEKSESDGRLKKLLENASVQFTWDTDIRVQSTTSTRIARIYINTGTNRPNSFGSQSLRFAKSSYLTHPDPFGLFSLSLPFSLHSGILPPLGWRQAATFLIVATLRSLRYWRYEIAVSSLDASNMVRH